MPIPPKTTKRTSPGLNLMSISSVQDENNRQKAKIFKIVIAGLTRNPLAIGDSRLCGNDGLIFDQFMLKFLMTLKIEVKRD